MGREAARAFKALAGQDRDEPMSSSVIAFYSFLFMLCLVLASAWAATGAPM